MRLRITPTTSSGKMIAIFTHCTIQFQLIVGIDRDRRGHEEHHTRQAPNSHSQRRIGDLLHLAQRTTGA